MFGRVTTSIFGRFIRSRPGHDAAELRRWLHRIEEACAKRTAGPELQAIRTAALAALQGKPAPIGFGVPRTHQGSEA